MFLLPLFTGLASAFASKKFPKRIDGGPPSWIFAPVWTILYLIMGYVLLKNKGNVPSIFWIQLALNFIWSPVFTRGFFKESFYIILALWTSILLTITEMKEPLLLPYLAWVTYAAHLNYMYV